MCAIDCFTRAASSSRWAEWSVRYPMRLRPEIAGIPESPLITIGTMAESMPGSIKLCYGEPDTATPEFISRAVYDAALAGHTFYTHTAGSPDLREAIEIRRQ